MKKIGLGCLGARCVSVSPLRSSLLTGRLYIALCLLFSHFYCFHSGDIPRSSSLRCAWWRVVHSNRLPSLSCNLYILFSNPWHSIAQVKVYSLNGRPTESNAVAYSLRSEDVCVELTSSIIGACISSSRLLDFAQPPGMSYTDAVSVSDQSDGALVAKRKRR